MKIAIMGFGTVGSGAYETAMNAGGIEVVRILARHGREGYEFLNDIITHIIHLRHEVEDFAPGVLDVQQGSDQPRLDRFSNGLVVDPELSAEGSGCGSRISIGAPRVTTTHGNIGPRAGNTIPEALFHLGDGDVEHIQIHSAFVAREADSAHIGC